MNNKNYENGNENEKKENIERFPKKKITHLIKNI